MKKILVKLALIPLIFFSPLFFPLTSYAVKFGLIAPSETLTRGQEVTFTITIDTEGKSYESLKIGLTYETQYLQFLNAIPGDTFSSISTEEINPGTIILTGTNDAPFSGQGTFAYVKFKLIAESPGSTQLCTLFNPGESPTPTPNPQQSPTPTPNPQQSPTPTPPPPTNLPKPGREETTRKALLASAMFILFPLGILGFRKLKLF